MSPLFFLGVGTIASAVRRAQPEVPATGTTRIVPDARFATIHPIAAGDHGAIRAAARDARVVVSFPPDGRCDAELAPCVDGASSVVYLSSTAVYPSSDEPVTEHTAVAPDSERAQLRLTAEAIWRERGASVVRLPAFYGLTTGLHLSLARGSFRMPGAGENVVSRVHVDDAARFVCAALSAPAGSLLLAGDDEPAPVAEVVAFVRELFGLPEPIVSQGEEIPLSLRASRRIDSHGTRERFGVRLAFPSYREGYRAIREQQKLPGDY